MNLHWSQDCTWTRAKDWSVCEWIDESEPSSSIDRNFHRDIDLPSTGEVEGFEFSHGSCFSNFVSAPDGQAGSLAQDDALQNPSRCFDVENAPEFEPPVPVVGSSSDFSPFCLNATDDDQSDFSNDAVRDFQAALQKTLQTFEQEYAWTSCFVPRKLHSSGQYDLSAYDLNESGREDDSSVLIRSQPSSSSEQSKTSAELLTLDRFEASENCSSEFVSDVQVQMNSKSTFTSSCLVFDDIDDDSGKPHSWARWCLENQRLCQDLDRSPLSTLPGSGIHFSRVFEKKQCRIADTVDVICVQDENIISFSVKEHTKHEMLRCFWHLHGQIADWSEMQKCIARSEIDSLAMTVCGNVPPQSFISSAASAPVLDSTSGHSSIRIDASRPDQLEQTPWWHDLQDAIQTVNHPGSRRFIMTWFLSKHRFHVSLQPRPVPIDRMTSVVQFITECKNRWKDLDDGRELTFQVVHPSPMGLPSTLKHIILLQGDFADYTSVLYYGNTLPILRRLRAVLFRTGSTVEDFFSAAQHPEACQGEDSICYVRYEQGNDEIRLTAQQNLWPPFASLVEGDIRILQSEDPPDHVDSDEEVDPGGSDQDTTFPEDDSLEEDDVESFVSGHPQVFQLDDDNPYPWENVHFDEPDEQELQQEEPAPNIQFAPQHEGYLQDEIEQLMNLDEEDETPWLAATFGLGLTALGRRDIHFQPHDLAALTADILQVWSDHAAYGDLILYNVHPQPLDKIGRRAIAILVVVDLPESMDESIRHVLVIEQSEGEIQVRNQPYGARLTSEASDREIMAHLHLHMYCAPFALRSCRIRLGTTYMQPRTFYEFDHGTLCRTWIGNTYPQIAEAAQYIEGAEQFFLQALSLMEAENAPSVVVCRLHGISPENQPLGARDVVIPLEWIYDLEWIREFQAIWPFADENLQMVFVASLTVDFEETGEATFHFIIKCGLEHGTPVLVRQQIIPVDHTIQHTHGATEYWAISLPSGEANIAVVQALYGWPFWLRFCREQNVYPHLTLNGVRLLDIRRDWRPGDLLQARFMVWDQRQVLTLMMGSIPNQFPTEPEATSFLQLNADISKTKIANHQIPNSAQNSLATFQPTLRGCWGANSDPSDPQGSPSFENSACLASSHVIAVPSQPPSWWNPLTATHGQFSQESLAQNSLLKMSSYICVDADSQISGGFTDCQMDNHDSACREGFGVNLDPSDSRSFVSTKRSSTDVALLKEMTEPILRGCWGDNSDPPDSQGKFRFEDSESFDSSHVVAVQRHPPSWWRLPKVTNCQLIEDDSAQHSTSTMSNYQHAVTDPQVCEAYRNSKTNDSELAPWEGFGANMDPSDSHSHGSTEQIPIDVASMDEIRHLRKLLNALFKPGWVGLNQQFEQIPDVHPFAQIAFEHTSSGNEAADLHVFTDGSCGRNTASWAFVLVGETQSHGKTVFCKLGYAAGLLDQGLGPTNISAIDAEATAIIAAADFLLSQKTATSTNILFHYDAVAAGHGATGQTNVCKCEGVTSPRQEAARTMISLLQQYTTSGKGTHVKAHQGHPWNEGADSLAVAVRCGWRPPIQAQLRCGPLLQHRLAPFAWIEVAPSLEMPGLEALLRNDKPHTFVGKGDETLQLKMESPAADTAQWTQSIKCATINVGTLNSFEDCAMPGVGHKAHELMLQFHAAEFHFVALQETRGKESQRTTIGPYVRLASAGTRGQAGVELWIDLGRMSKIANCSLQATQDLCTWHQTSRIMATTLHCGSMTLEILVCYAPQKGRELQEIAQFWNEVDQLLRRCTPGASVFMMGDFNCRLGSVLTPGIGCLNPDFEDEGGELCRSICDQHHLCIPSTMPDLHVGDSATFIGTRNSQSRIDFIAISQHMRDGVCMSFVDKTIDVQNGERDHSVLVLHLELTFKTVGSSGFQKRISYDRTAARLAKNSGQYDAFECFPQQDWMLDVNEHWNQMRMFLQQESKRAFPLPKRQQRQDYFDSDTWQVLCHKKDLRQQHRALEKETDRCKLALFFKAWKQPNGSYDDFSDLRFSLHVALQQEAVLLEAREKITTIFRKRKQQNWKDWVQKKLKDQVEELKHVKATEIYRILRPKRIIDAKCGKLKKHLPGLCDKNGIWRTSRSQIAVAWQTQFADIENADNATMQDLLDSSKPYCQSMTCDHLCEMPSLLDLERALRALRDTKAPGLDGLGAEMYQGNVANAARRLYPMVFKMFARQQAIVEHTGGWLVPLWKGKGSTTSMPQYRAILLEATVARAVSKTWRPRLAQGIERAAQPLQYGGRKGLAIEALHLQTRIWQANARKTHQSLSIIFVDIQSAFYTVVKQMVTGFDGTEDALATLFLRLKMPPSAMEEFISNVKDGENLQHFTQSTFLAGSTSASLSHTWFAVQHGDSLQAPATGSRPGDPNADLLFSFEQTAFGPIAFHAAWVDDVAFAVFGSAEEILGKTASLMAIIIDVATEHAMRLSFGPGKTAILVEYHGKHAVKARQQCDKLPNGILPILSEHLGCTKVHLTNRYRYLGGFLVRGGSCLQEIRTRTACALRNILPLRKILANGDIDCKHRQTLFRSMGLSVYTLHSGTWFNLSQGEFNAWHAGVYRLYQTIRGRTSQGDVQHDDMCSLAHHMGAPMPMELMYLSRLRLLFHLIKTADKYIIAAILQNFHIAGNDSWLYGAIKSVQWLQSQLGVEKVPPELLNLQELSTWHHFKDASSELKKLLRQGEQAHMLRVQNLHYLREHHAKQDELLKAMNWQCHGEEEQRICEHVCNDCGKSFKDQAALAAHQQRKHHKRVAMRFLAADDICRACHRKYHTRPRLIQHLHHSQTSCWVWHLRSYHPMSQEQADELDEEDRRKGVASHQHGFKDPQIDKAWARCHPDEFRHVLPLRADGPCSMEAPSEAELAEWANIGLLPVDRGGRTKTKRGIQDFTIENVVRDASALERQLCSRVQSWEPFHDWVPRPMSHGTKYFLILFAGHRRFGDLSCWFEWGSDIVPIPLDLAIDEHFGDILRDNLWIQLIHSRRVVGCHAAPPCETFSEARWLPPEEGVLPRPLRDNENPWGLDCRSLPEVAQCVMGNILMLKAIFLVLLTHLFGGSTTLEHPRGPIAEGVRWCIWRASFILELLLDSEYQLVTFLQGPLGRPFSKPTNLLAGRLRGLASMIFAAYDPRWRPTQVLGGRSNGKWKTMAAKEYPVKMCEVLAKAHIQYASTLEEEGSEPEPQMLNDALAALCGHFDPYLVAAKGTQMRSDYRAATISMPSEIT
eukprot:s2365_g9.t1